MVGGFQVGRGKDQDQADIFPKRSEFLLKRSGGSDFFDFCKVLDQRFGVSGRWEAERRQTEGGASGAVPVDIPDRWRGLPWITPVLGSGCYDVPDEAGILPMTAEREIKDALDPPDGARSASLEDAHQQLVDIGLEPAPHVAAFVRQLAEERSPVPPEPAGPVASDDASGLSLDDAAVLMALTASYLTLLYRQVQLATGTPFDRYDETYARFGPKARLSDVAANAGGMGLASGHIQGAQLIKDLALVLADIIKDLSAVVERAGLNPKVARGLQGLLEEVRDDLTSKQLRSSQVRFVTEAAWYLLARKAAIYHGWADLLFEIMVNDSEPRSHRSPYFQNFQEGPKEVLPALMLDATEKSWARRSTGSEMKRFYAAVAGVMWAQHEAHRAKRSQRSSSSLPPSSAFVTSFDLELEMALWESMGRGESFAVIVPVYVSASGREASAYPCWLRGIVGRSGEADGLDEIREPASWRLLFSGVDSDELREIPNVVRLCGSPLVKLPRLEQMPDVLEALAEVRILADADWCITHAITFNEYLAIRQSEAELILGIPETGPSGAKPPTRSLPRDLGASSSDRTVVGQNPRYWFGAGVPLGDRAVRHRLISQITATRVWNEVDHRSATPPSAGRSGVVGGEGNATAPDEDDWFSATGEIEAATSVDTASTRSSAVADSADAYDDRDGDQAGPTPNLAGVMVNRRVANDEGLLLSWFGLDAVQAMASEFTGDLEHYALHLRRMARPPLASVNGEGQGLRPELEARSTWGSLQRPCPLHDATVRS